MTEFVVCPMELRTISPGRQANIPRVRDYSTDFASYSGLGVGKAWCLCAVFSWNTRAAAALDTQMKIFSTSDLAHVLSVTEAASVNVQLLASDLGVTAVSGQTVYDVIKAIGTAMGHSADFDPARL